MNRKRKRPEKRQSVKGIPGIGLDVGLESFLTKIDQTSGQGQLARDEIADVITDCIVRLLEVALPSREKAAMPKDWAGRLLASLHATLEANQWNLARENPAYRESKARLGKTRANVLVPKSDISEMVQQELRTAMSYQFKLLVMMKLGGTQQYGTPREYLNTVDLPYFCGDADSKDKWWKWLWSRIRTDRNVLLPGRDLSKTKKQIRDYFDDLVVARESGTF
jgi:hypothetical protein